MNKKHHFLAKPNPTHGLTQPMSISASATAYCWVHDNFACVLCRVNRILAVAPTVLKLLWQAPFVGYITLPLNRANKPLLSDVI